MQKGPGYWHQDRKAPTEIAAHCLWIGAEYLQHNRVFRWLCHWLVRCRRLPVLALNAFRSVEVFLCTRLRGSVDPKHLL